MSTVEKALGLLDHFSEDMPEIGLSEFKALTSYDKGTTHRYLTALRNCGFLEQNPVTRAYRLGPALIRLSIVREATVPLRNSAKSIVTGIADELEELVHASLPVDKGMSLLCKADGGYRGTRVALDGAEILPFYATASGIAMMAFGAPSLRQKGMAGTRHRYTPRTEVDTDKIERMIERTVRDGFSQTEQTFEAEVDSVAVPFFDQQGHAVGTLAAATPSSRMTDEKRAHIVTLLARGSRDLSEMIGGQMPPHVAQALHPHLP